MKITIVIPAYNEGRRLNQVIASIRKMTSGFPIIIVDDGSKRPVRLRAKSDLTILRHQINLGKGAALKTGVDYAFDHQAQAVILMDADGQHDPAEIPDFVEKLEQKYDLVFGTRRTGQDMPMSRLLLNKFSSILVNLLFGVYVSDIPSGFRALTQKAYRKVFWESARYSVETEMVVNLGKHRDELKYIEIPVKTVYKDLYKGFTVLNALSIFWQVLWWKLF